MDSSHQPVLKFPHMKDDIELVHGLLCILLAAIFFQIINLALRTRCPRGVVLKDGEWRWRNVYVSWLHSTLSTIWTLSCVLLYPEMLEDLFSHVNYVTYFCVCFSTGYFTYDLYDIVSGPALSGNLEVVVHHLVVCGVFYFDVFLKSGIGLNTQILWVELNSVFLHWRKMLHMTSHMTSELKTSRTYLAIKYLNLFTFVVFRFTAVFFIPFQCFVYRSFLPLSLQVILGVGCPLLIIMNVVLFWRLVKSDILRGADGQQGSPLTSLRRDFAVLVKGKQAGAAEGQAKVISMSQSCSEDGHANRVDVKENGTNGHVTSCSTQRRQVADSHGVPSHLEEIKKRD